VNDPENSLNDSGKTVNDTPDCPACRRFSQDVLATAEQLQHIQNTMGGKASRVILNVTPEGRFNPSVIQVAPRNIVLTSNKNSVI
jgi:hypothetical protein